MLHCDFCKKDSTQVRVLIAAEGGVAICDECTLQAMEVVLKNIPPRKDELGPLEVNVEESKEE